MELNESNEDLCDEPVDSQTASVEMNGDKIYGVVQRMGKGTGKTRAMNNSTTNLPTSRPVKSLCSSGQSNGGQRTSTGARAKETRNAYGPEIAQAALQTIGLSTRSIYGPFISPPEYALAVSIIFTKATEQTIMLGTPPEHVLSTGILYNTLLHDARFNRVPMSEAVPGDIIMEPGWQPDGYGGIVVEHGRIISNSSRGVRDNSSLVEFQRSQPAAVIFRYIGVQGHRSQPLANAGFNPSEARLPAGQSGGGQWTTGGAGGAQNGKGQPEMAPSTIVLSGGSRETPSEKTPDLPAFDVVTDYLGDVAKVWKGYGDAITDSVVGLWNVFRHPVNNAKGVVAGVSYLVKDPVGTLKAIGQNIADDFTSGDPRKAGKLVGQVLIALAGTEFSTEKLASLLPKVERAAAGESVSLTAEETEIVQRVMSGKELRVTEDTGFIRGGRTDTPHHVTDTASNDALRARQRLSLNTTPEYKTTLEVPKGKFSPPARVAPHKGMPGGGMERVAKGEIPVRIIKIKKLK